VIWEVAIKSSLGRQDFVADPRLLRRGLLENGATELTITSDHGLALVGLPPIHKDPFDRIQVAQARVEGLVLLTADPVVAQYGSPVELV
jgi:PIN domain nuclease of toxin-antitoxin system